MKAFSLAIDKKQKQFFFEKPNNQKPKIKNLNKCHFQGFTNIQFFILEQFLQFKSTDLHALNCKKLFPNGKLDIGGAGFWLLGFSKKKFPIEIS